MASPDTNLKKEIYEERRQDAINRRLKKKEKDKKK